MEQMEDPALALALQRLALAQTALFMARSDLRRFQKMHGQSSATIGQQRDLIARLRYQLMHGASRAGGIGAEGEADRGRPAGADDVVDWMLAGERVRAFSASDRSMTRWEGQIIGYRDHPSVIIQLDSGEQPTWAAHLVEPAAGPPASSTVPAAGDTAYNPKKWTRDERYAAPAQDGRWPSA